MARKITLSIPDMLHEKMEEWRKSFNLSKMFQDALTEAINKKEEFQRRLQEDINTSEIIERLRREKMQSEGNYAERGKSEGLQWAKRAHYDDLMYALDLNSANENDIPNDARLGMYFTETINSDDLMETSADGVNKYAKLFLESWSKGLSEFWNEIKEKI